MGEQVCAGLDRIEAATAKFEELAATLTEELKRSGLAASVGKCEVGDDFAAAVMREGEHTSDESTTETEEEDEEETPVFEEDLVEACRP